MFETIKKNGEIIRRIIVNQIGMTMFGNVLYMASVAAGISNAGTGQTMKVLTSVFSVLFYLVLLYVLAHDEGLKDEIRIESGRIKYDPFKFLWLSLAANLLNIIVGIFFSVVGVVLLSGASSPQWFSQIALIFYWTFRITEGMYIGIWVDLLSNFAFVPILCVLPSIIVCTVGYIIGTKGGIKRIIAKAGKEPEQK